MLGHTCTYVGDIYTKGGFPCVTASLADLLEDPPTLDSGEPGFIQLASAPNAIRYTKKLWCDGVTSQYLGFDLDLKDVFKVDHKYPWADANPSQAQSIQSGVLEWMRGIGPGVLYLTKHGLRVVLCLPSPIRIGLRGTAYECIAEACRTRPPVPGGEPLAWDTSCGDWTRLFRLPYPGALTWEQLDTPFSAWLLGIIASACEKCPAETDANTAPAATEPPAQEPAVPENLSDARSALPRWLQDDLRDLRSFDTHRDTRMLKATTAVAESLRRFPTLCSYDHVYHLLKPAVESFGYDESEGCAYLDRLPRFTQTAVNNALSTQELCDAIAASKPTPVLSGTVSAPVENGVSTTLVPLQRAVPEFVINLRRHLPIPPDLHTESQAVEWLKQKSLLILNMEDRFNIMTKNGYYLSDFFGFHQLRTRIRKHSDPAWFYDIIAWYDEESSKWKDKSQKSIVDESCEVVDGYRIVYGHDGSTLIHDGDRTLLGLNMFKYRQLEPVRDLDVEEWLRHLVEHDQYDYFMRAITALARPQNGQTPAVALIGEKGCGKNMLVMGLCELFNPSFPATDDALFTEFEDSMLKRCIIHIDEKCPPSARISAKLRRLTNSGILTLNPKGKGKMEVPSIHRLIMTANNKNIIEAITGTDSLNRMDVDALAARIHYFEIRKGAADYLISKGDLDHTTGWAWYSEEKPSEYRIAKHLLWEMRRVWKFEGDNLIRPPGRFICNVPDLTQVRDIIDVARNEDDYILMHAISLASKSWDKVDDFGIWIPSAVLWQKLQAAQPNIKQRRLANALSSVSCGLYWRPTNLDPRYYCIPFHALEGKLQESGHRLSGLALERFESWVKMPESARPYTRTLPTFKGVEDAKVADILRREVG